MYLPSHFEESRPEVLHQLIHDHPFGMLVTLGQDGLNANHIPFELDPTAGPFGTLRAHVARANPVWRDFNAELDVLAVLQGAQSYISPSWYPGKQENGKVVPTWNYIVVHAYGAVASGRGSGVAEWPGAALDRTPRGAAKRSRGKWPTRRLNISKRCYRPSSASKSRSRS